MRGVWECENVRSPVKPYDHDPDLRPIWRPVSPDVAVNTTINYTVTVSTKIT